MLFVHAGVATRAMWDPQFDDLAADHFVIRYDTRGYGESRGEDEEFADRHDVLAVLDAVGVDRATVIGASRGGRIALDAAARCTGPRHRARHGRDRPRAASTRATPPRASAR